MRSVVPFSTSRSTRSPDGRPPTTSVMSRAGTVREPSASILPGTQAVMPISRLVAVSLSPASSVRSSTLASTGRELRLLTARLTTDRPRARFSCITESFTSGLPAPRYRVGIFSSRHHHHAVDGVDDRIGARSWAVRQGWPRSDVDRSGHPSGTMRDRIRGSWTTPRDSSTATAAIRPPPAAAADHARPRSTPHRRERDAPVVHRSSTARRPPRPVPSTRRSRPRPAERPGRADAARSTSSRRAIRSTPTRPPERGRLVEGLDVA